MKHYNRIKNLILAGMVGFIYYKHIVPSIPVLKELFALAFVCVMMYASWNHWMRRFEQDVKSVKKWKRVHSLGRDVRTRYYDNS